MLWGICLKLLLKLHCFKKEHKAVKTPDDIELMRFFSLEPTEDSIPEDGLIFLIIFAKVVSYCSTNNAVDTRY